MNQKSILLATSCFASIVVFTMGFVARFLLYRWVHVPSYLWILFIADIPFSISVTVMAEALKSAANKS